MTTFSSTPSPSKLTAGAVADALRKNTGMGTEVMVRRCFAIMSEYPDVETFARTDQAGWLAAFRKVRQTSIDLGKHTYDALKWCARYVVTFDADQRKAAEAEAKAKADAERKAAEAEALAKAREEQLNPTYTLAEIKAIAVVMEMAGFQTIRLKQVKSLFECFGMDFAEVTKRLAEYAK